MPEQPPYFAHYLAYLEAIRTGEYEKARALLARTTRKTHHQGKPQREALRGHQRDRCAALRLLRVFAHDRSVWIPFEAVREIIIHEPKDSFDLIWVSASITTWEGLSMNCCMPVVYPETFLGSDEQAKMGGSRTGHLSEEVCRRAWDSTCTPSEEGHGNPRYPLPHV
jgi:type VI secretion system protein ImpE